MEKEVKKISKKSTNKSKKQNSNNNKVIKNKKTQSQSPSKIKKITAELELIKQENKKQKVINSKLIKNNKSLKFSIIALVLVIIVLIVTFITLVNYHYKNVYHGPKEVKVINNVLDNNYIFLGDSITEGYNLDKFYEGYPVVNSGIGGYTTQKILEKLPKMVYRYNPTKVFLLIGTNDIAQEKTKEEIVDNIGKIIDNIKENRKYTEIYIESIYPIDSDKEKRRSNNFINEINEGIKLLCEEKEVTYINTHNLLTDENGELKNEYSKDGLHLNDDAYQVITEELKKYLD